MLKLLPYKFSKPKSVRGGFNPKSVKVVKRTVFCITLNPLFYRNSQKVVIEYSNKLKRDNNKKDIFERLGNGEPIPSNDAQAHKMRDASYATKKLLIQMITGQARPELGFY